MDDEALDDLSPAELRALKSLPDLDADSAKARARAQFIQGSPTGRLTANSQSFMQLPSPPPPPTQVPLAQVQHFPNVKRMRYLFDSFVRTPDHLLADGTVIMFQTLSSTRRQRFTYVAVWTAEHWFITGRGEWYGTNKLTHVQLTEALRGRDVENFAIVQAWAMDEAPF